MKPKLVVMAAGLGSRYGGLKQMEPVTNEGEIILDFSVYDAMHAGFDNVIFIISAGMESVFEERVAKPIGKYMNVTTVIQDINDLPAGYRVPDGRVKPWGTCHAVLAAEKLLDCPFAVVNADDYYGPSAFQQVYQYLSENNDEAEYCMAGYYIQNTLSEKGTVTRGVCKIDGNAYLTEIKETKEIGWQQDKILFPDIDGKISEIKQDTVVSMNFWGFKPSMIKYMKDRFSVFLTDALKNDPMKAEYLLPVEVGYLLQKGNIRVKVLDIKEKWYGVTYRNDSEVVRNAFSLMKKDGKYPQILWQ